MDDRIDDAAARADGPQIGDSSLRAVHGLGVLAAIAAAVAVCGFALLAFLGRLGTASADVDGDRPEPVARPFVATSADGYRVPPPADVTPSPEQQAAFLETIRLSGTGGWSSRLEILGNGMRACRLLAEDRQPPDVVSTLVAAGEPAPQAQAVVVAAPDTLCPS